METTLVDFTEAGRFEEAFTNLLGRLDSVIDLAVKFGVWVNVVGTLLVLYMIMKVSQEIASMRKLPGDDIGRR